MRFLLWKCLKCGLEIITENDDNIHVVICNGKHMSTKEMIAVGSADNIVELLEKYSSNP